MTDWTANSGFGALSASREPVFRSKREPALRGDGIGGVRPEPRIKAEAIWEDVSDQPPAALRAEPRHHAEEPQPRLSPGAAALARYNAAIEGPLAKARLALWAGGGLLSLALIGGVGVWGYKLVLREVMGLPVVAAEAGPMRVLPADPQGEVVPSQGLAVNAIPGAGTVAPPSDVLVLAPQTPGLAEEDMQVVQSMAEADEVVPAAAPVVSAVATDPLALVEAGTELAAPAQPAEQPMSPSEVIAMADSVAAAPPSAAPAATVAPPVSPAPVAAAAAAAQVVPAAPMAAAPAPVPASPVASVEAADPATAPSVPAAGPAPVQAAPVAEVMAAMVAETAALAVIPASVPGVAAALRPPVRPATLAAPSATLTVRPADEATLTVSAAPAEPVAQPAPTAEPAPVLEATPAPAPEAPAAAAALTADLPAGTNLVQLGAFDSPEIAASEWTRLQGVFGPFLGDKERVIQETQSNGRTFYRLRAMGLADRSAATALCAALTAENAACIPVTVD